MPLGIIAAGISAIGGIIGASSQKREQDKSRSTQEKANEAQYQYNKKNYEYDWQETLANYDYIKQGIGIQRANEEKLAAYRDKTNLQDYNYRLKIQDYEYKLQKKLYNKSESIYKQQRGFNSQAALLAYQAENRRMQEAFQEAAFDNQDLLVQLIEEEGKAAARGQSGRSAGKAIQSIVASYGRNQAILAESLVSAGRQNAVNLRDINLGKYAADLNAEANRMLLPTKLPSLPKPLKTPRATFQNPRKPKKPPKPIKAVNTVARGSSVPIWNAAISGVAGVVGAYGTYKSNKEK